MTNHKRVSYPTLLWLFVAGSLLGFVSEGVFHFVRTGEWAMRVATVSGPFCIIYGAGAVVMYLASLHLQDKSILAQFSVYALVGSLVEYLGSVFQQAAFGTMSWDYSAHALNIGGRISLKMTLLWGIAGLALAHIVLPSVLRAFGRLQLDSRRTACMVMSVYMGVNLLITGCALARWQSREAGIPPQNRIEQSLDKRYGSDWMRERFPNMQFVSNQQ